MRCWYYRNRNRDCLLVDQARCFAQVVSVEERVEEGDCLPADPVRYLAQAVSAEERTEKRPVATTALTTSTEQDQRLGPMAQPRWEEARRNSWVVRPPWSLS
jgi:hypothetical protein